MQEWTEEIESEVYDKDGRYIGVWKIGVIPGTNQYIFLGEISTEIKQDKQGNISVNI